MATVGYIAKLALRTLLLIAYTSAYAHHNVETLADYLAQHSGGVRANELANA